MPIRLPTIRRGELITAQFLSSLSRAINEVNATIGEQIPIPQTGQTIPDDAAVEEIEELEDDELDLPSSSLTWREVSRVTETVRVENPEDPEQYVDVNRIVSMRMQNGLGDEEIRIFNNG